MKRGKSLEGLGAAATIRIGNYVTKEQKRQDVDDILKNIMGMTGETSMKIKLFLVMFWMG